MVRKLPGMVTKYIKLVIEDFNIISKLFINDLLV